MALTLASANDVNRLTVYSSEGSTNAPDGTMPPSKRSAFDLLDQLPNVIQRKPWTQIANVPRFDFKRCPPQGVFGLVARPRRNVSLMTSLKERSSRRDSALSFAATSSSKVRVVLML